MRFLGFVSLLLVISSCTTTPAPPPTDAPTQVPIIVATAEPAEAVFLKALKQRINVDDTIPTVGRAASFGLLAEPGYVFSGESGYVLQFHADLPEIEEEIRKTAVLLIGTSVIMADEHNLPLEGIEVVFFTKDQKPWVAVALAPPWNMDDIRLAPLHPDLMDQLQEQGVITPTPKPVY